MSPRPPALLLGGLIVCSYPYLERMLWSHVWAHETVHDDLVATTRDSLVTRKTQMRAGRVAQHCEVAHTVWL